MTNNKANTRYKEKTSLTPLAQGKGSTKEIQKPVYNTSINTQAKICWHHGFVTGSLAELYIQYACEISNFNKDFVLTMNSENGSREIGKVGPTNDIGLCQISRRRHPEITSDKRFLTDYKRHIDQCRRLYSGGTRFYGYDHRLARARGLIEINGKMF